MGAVKEDPLAVEFAVLVRIGACRDFGYGTDSLGQFGRQQDLRPGMQDLPVVVAADQLHRYRMK